MSITATLIVVCLSAVQTQTPAPPADLAVVVRAAQDSSMSEADRTKLVGKEYTGVVTIRTVRLRPDGAAVIEAEAPSEAGKPRVRVRFLTHSTDKALDTLSRDLEVRVRARLSSLAGTATAPVVDFTEMSIVTGG